MGRGSFPRAGGGMGNMMKQVQKMQKQLEETQKQLELQEISATAGGGMVEVVVNGKKEVVKVSIKPEVVDPEDVETLEDMIIVATNEALRKISEISDREMGRLTSGLSIPGL